MLLFFFMTVTTLRETEQLVTVKLPEASQAAKIERKDIVSYIYIGSPVADEAIFDDDAEMDEDIIDDDIELDDDVDGADDMELVGDDIFMDDDDDDLFAD